MSGSEDLDKECGRYRDYFANTSSYTITNYKGFRGATGAAGEISLDLAEALPPGLKKRFDVVFSHTTLEHIFDTQIAFRNLCAMSRNLVIVVVPFAQVTHWSDSFGDYWRFTPMGLRRIYEENEFTVVHEAAGPPRGEPIYLFFVGSKQPDRWDPVLPRERIDGPIGEWIGIHLWFDRIRPVSGASERLRSSASAPVGNDADQWVAVRALPAGEEGHDGRLGHFVGC